MIELIKAGADPLEANSFGVMPLHIAMAGGSAEDVKNMLDAIKNRSPDKLQAAFEARDTSNKWTPLHFAILRGDASDAKALLDVLKENAPEQLVEFLDGMSGDKPRLEGFKTQRPNIADDLQVAYDEAKTKLTPPPPAAAPALAPRVYNDAKTAELQVLMNDPSANLEAMAQLIQDGADPNVKAEFGQTPLHFAARDPEALQIMVNVFGDDKEALKAALTKPDNLGQTPLHFAAGDPEALQIMVDVFGDDKEALKANLIDQRGGVFAPLHFATGDPICLQILNNVFKEDKKFLEKIKAFAELSPDDYVFL
jgi:hypothetical protein